MTDRNKEIRELREKTAQTRYRFLKVELLTCFTALEMAQFELSVGNTPVVEKEIASVKQAIRVIQRFLPEASAAQRSELQAQLEETKEKLALLEAEVGLRSMGQRGGEQKFL